jgi:hypothetical protein
MRLKCRMAERRLAGKLARRRRSESFLHLLVESVGSSIARTGVLMKDEGTVERFWLAR